MVKRIVFCIFAIVISIANVSAKSKTISPLDFGLEKARTGIDRYNALLRCHQEAAKKGLSVSYRGIGRLEIEIPEEGISIPLPNYTDFFGVEMIVKTTGKAKFLFAMSKQTKRVMVTGDEIDGGDFRRNPSLKTGKYLLVVSDETLWVKNRKGYDYGATRRDVFYIKNGRSNERPISSYRTEMSKPAAVYCAVSSDKKVVKNLKILRASDSPVKVFCIQINNQYNVELSNITITTPEDEHNFGDAAIQILNCVSVTMNDIKINGTYSQKGRYGYGVNADNVNGLIVNRMSARAKWGVFGTNNMSNVRLKDCSINRFDIHCYGRDVAFNNCNFVGLYNQFSSIYGKIIFKKCSFSDFIPVLIESSYNAYTPFELIWKDCIFYLDKKHNYLMTLFGVPEGYNERHELRRKSLPNITIKNCKVAILENMDNWVLIKTDGLYYKEPFDNITDINIKNLKTEGGKNANLKLYSEDIKTSEQVNVRIR